MDLSAADLVTEKRQYNRVTRIGGAFTAPPFLWVVAAQLGTGMAFRVQFRLAIKSPVMTNAAPIIS